MADTIKTIKRPGRPRSEEARTALLQATTKLMNEMPIRSISISQIAREAGVGKPTIYRWWDSKCSIVMDAFLHDAGPQIALPPSDTAKEALQLYIRNLIHLLNGKAGKTIAEIVGEGQSDPHIIEEFHARFFTQLLAPARSTIESGQSSGEFDATLNIDQALDLVFGPIYFRLIVGPRTLDAAFEKLVTGKGLNILLPDTN